MILDNDTIGVTTSIRRVVVSSVVVDDPIRKLKMAVAADGVQIERIGRAHLTYAKFQTADRHFCRQVQRSARALGRLLAERNDLMQLHPGHIWFCGQVGIPHYVEIGEAGQTEGLADAAPSCAFNVQQEFGALS